MNELKNTDKEIWREIEGEYYSPSIFVTEYGKIGINVGGHVYVQSIEQWHQQADRIAELEKENSELKYEKSSGAYQGKYLEQYWKTPQTNAEPVGRFYWESVVDGHVMAVPSEGTPHYNNDDFPLYTTPQTKQCKDCGEINPAEIHTCSPQTKPLSDEEIEDIWMKRPVGKAEDIFVFARAIEERILGNGRYRSK